MFQQMGVRTIFDLERAVLSRQSMPGVKRMVGAILLMGTHELFKLSEGRAPAFADLEAGRSTAGMALPEFLGRVVDWLAFPPIGPAIGGAEVSPADAGPGDAGLMLCVRMMLDDLHVHRLREIWLKVDSQLGGESSRLRDTTPAA